MVGIYCYQNFSNGYTSKPDWPFLLLVVVCCIPELGLLPKGNAKLLLLTMLLSIELLKGEAETVFREDDDDIGKVRHSSR